ncbi:hypothetical protein DPMN_077438 [Dreissena polymorpha]|uniref:WSC domain-containing protein n=1 Tax=Dreissena polymorpha TaxID=45954 RepID=A0A9D4BPL9_DREPO|nr:hypothetical protein DPMN_077438 [Dreissena polymorpha]
MFYLGCYEDKSAKRVLPHAVAEARNNNTSGECGRRCSDYRYAGVEVVFVLNICIV